MSLTRHLLRTTSFIRRHRLKFVFLVFTTTLIYLSSVISIIPRIRTNSTNFEKSYLLSDIPFQSQSYLPSSENDTRNDLQMLNVTKGVQSSQALQLNEVDAQKNRGRFKFIYKKQKLSLDGPIYNSIPSRVTWRHDLHHIEICNLTYPSILAVVPSAVGNKVKREDVRQSWANPQLYPHTGIRAVFVVGATENKTLQEDVDQESAKYNDVIQYNFIDSYRNLTYKTMSWLTWVNSHCPEVPFIAKVDDDVIVNPFHLKAYLDGELKKTVDSKAKVSDGEDVVSVHRPELKHPATNYIYGKLETHPPPHRKDKWSLTLDEYPEGRYPPFVLGPAYIFGGNVVRRLLKYAPYTPFIWLEDVYTTGLVAHAAQIQHVQTKELLFCVRRYSPELLLQSGKKCFWMENKQRAANRKAYWKEILRLSGKRF